MRLFNEKMFMTAYIWPLIDDYIWTAQRIGNEELCRAISMLMLIRNRLVNLYSGSRCGWKHIQMVYRKQTTDCCGWLEKMKTTAEENRRKYSVRLVECYSARHSVPWTRWTSPAVASTPLTASGTVPFSLVLEPVKPKRIKKKKEENKTKQ